MLVGKLICEKCGRDCTNGLWGFILGTRGTIRNRKQQEDLESFKKMFGKDTMVWCWECTALAFNAKPVEVPPKEEPVVEKAEQFQVPQ